MPNPPGALKITSIQRTASWERDLLSKSRPLQKVKNFSKASRLNSSASVSERSSSPAVSRPWVSVDQERAKELSLPLSFLATSSSTDPCPSPCLSRLRLERTGLLSGSPEILRFWIVLLLRLLFPLRPDRSPFEGKECLLSSSSTSSGVASRAPDGPRRLVPSRSWLPEGRRETAGTVVFAPWSRLLRLLLTRLSSTNWPGSGWVPGDGPRPNFRLLPNSPRSPWSVEPASRPAGPTSPPREDLKRLPASPVRDVIGSRSWDTVAEGSDEGKIPPSLTLVLFEGWPE